jgi:hypothetical protein
MGKIIPGMAVTYYYASAILHGKSLFYLFALFFLTAGLSGCISLNDPEASQEYSSDLVGTLDPQTTLGQTFVSRRPLLNGITLWFTPIVNQGAPSSTRTTNPIEDCFVAADIGHYSKPPRLP